MPPGTCKPGEQTTLSSGSYHFCAHELQQGFGSRGCLAALKGVQASYDSPGLFRQPEA